MNLIERINYVSIEATDLETENELVLVSTKRKVFNNVFIIGCIVFISSMFLKANIDNRLPAIPLGLGAFILFAGVWKLSASAKIVFDCYEQKLFKIYSHLGYFQKIYTVPLTSIERMESEQIKDVVKLSLIRDNGERILISNTVQSDTAKRILTIVNDFLSKNNHH